MTQEEQIALLKEENEILKTFSKEMVHLTRHTRAGKNAILHAGYKAYEQHMDKKMEERAERLKQLF